jgi:hypothetical protein
VVCGMHPPLQALRFCKPTLVRFRWQEFAIKIFICMGIGVVFQLWPSARRPYHLPLTSRFSCFFMIHSSLLCFLGDFLKKGMNDCWENCWTQKTPAPNVHLDLPCGYSI